MIHCIATPFLFLITTCSTTCCASAPLWWQWIDYAFLFISAFAIYNSTKNTKSEIVKKALWVSWLCLFILILNAKFVFFHSSEYVKFIPAFSLIALHFYNLKYCQCNEVECC